MRAIIAPAHTSETWGADPIGRRLNLGEHDSIANRRFPQLTILGGCCGTDERHVREIARACVTAAWPRSASVGIVARR
jgi:Homocysteine S-methyltransferase